MARLHAQVTIDAPAEAVLEVVGHRFDRIGEWATVIASSGPAPGEARVTGAPVAGRVCHTGIGLVPQVTERLVDYDEETRGLTHEAEGLPRFLGAASNRWHVTALDEHRTIVGLDATLEVHGVLGRILYPLVRLWIARTTPRFLDDLRHYVETGRPSPRKRRQLRTTSQDLGAARGGPSRE
jgi:hypothetical protein